jgi:hypothetical protein
MLDAYIIDRIRRERERDRARHRDGRVPLHIEPPRVPPQDEDRPSREGDQPERGSVIIDFQV